MSFTERLVGSGDERAEHDLTLRRTLVALGWAAALALVLVAVSLVAIDGTLGGLGFALAVLAMALVMGSAVVAVPLLVGSLWVLRRCRRGRAPRVVVGAAAGLVFGVAVQMLVTAMAPWTLAATQPGYALVLIGIPLIAGAGAGAIVGPRPPARLAPPGRDERAEDALLDGPGAAS